MVARIGHLVIFSTFSSIKIEKKKKKIPTFKLWNVTQGWYMHKEMFLGCSLFSKNVPKVVLRYRDLKFARL